MPEISMTTFVDFVLASGTQRLTVVRRAKADYQTKYDPARDFYRLLREGIVEMHQMQKPRVSLDGIVQNLSDAKKVAPYLECIDAYKRWCGKKQFEWVGAYSIDWKCDDLVVRVNPELGMCINDAPHVITLYFKGESPSKQRLETMFHLLELSLPAELRDATPGILDVRRGNLFKPNRDIPSIGALLMGDALAFQTMWDRV